MTLSQSRSSSAGPSRVQLEGELADELLQRAKVDAAGLERARRVQRGTGERLELILTRLGLVTEGDMTEALAKVLRLPLVSPDEFPTEPVLEGKISARFLKEARVLPIGETAEGILLATADPLDEFAIQSVRVAAGRPVVPRVARPADIEAAFERLYGGASPAIADIVAGGDFDEQQSLDDISRLKDLASEAPVIRLVNHLIARAVEARASDIHLEPFDDRLVARLRIDGVLREIDSPPSGLRAAVVSRIKIMAKLNIAERRLPQDGRIRIAVRGKEIDLRVSTVPTMHGESVVLRILDRGSLKLDFAGLGLREEALRRFLDMLERPHGILLVTGPTGSGKTTTLYASLLHLRTPEKKIITVEDPVEYQLDGVNQIQVKPQIGLGFANVLRSILRQDPDIIMVGEIRDLETAEIAAQASLTGHLVLSTLHTNDAPSTITRLLDMGVADYLLASTINGVVAQRLVRTLCQRCRAPHHLVPELIERLRAGPRPDLAAATIYRAVGCPACANSGYFGRTAIAEMLPITDEVRRVVLREPDAQAIRRVALAEGMRTMFDDGLAKVLEGRTTLDEVLRVTREG